MKVAGRKNDGAWTRTNKDIAKLDSGLKSQLAAYINSESDFVDAAYNDMVTLQTTIGVDVPNFPATKADWLSALVTSGIPRQVWFGRLTWTTYTKGGDGKYRADYQSNILQFAKDLRRACKNFFMTLREANNFANVGVTREAGTPGHGGRAPL